MSSNEHIVCTKPLADCWMDLPCYDDMGRYHYGTLIFENEAAWKEFQTRVSNQLHFLLSFKPTEDVNAECEIYARELYKEEYKV